MDDASTQKPSLPGILPDYPVVGPQQPNPTTTTENMMKYALGERTTPSGPLYLPPFLPIRRGQPGSV